MSKALLKRSLEIVEGSSSASSARTSFGKCRQTNNLPVYVSSNHVPSPTASSKSARNPFAPPSSTEQHAEYRAVKTKSLKPSKQPNNSKKPRAQPAARRSAIEVAHEHLRNGQSRADENLRKLLMLSGVKLDATTTDRLVRRAQNKRYIIDVEKPAEESASVFTDEDFAKFEREYFC